jgi:sialidase-1
VFFNKLYHANGNYIMPAEARQAILNQPGQTDLGSYITTSTDNGYTWSPAKFIKTSSMPYSSVEGPTDAPIEMPDGSLIMAIIGYSPHGQKGNRAAALIRSTDKGTTWSHVSLIATDPGAKLGGFMEPGIVRTKTGRLVVALRNHGTEQAIWVTHSDDDGKSWAPVKQTAMIGHPVDLIQLKDGRLLASYGIRPGSHTTPGGIRACFSKDNGVTWDIHSEVQLRNDFLGRDIGYPESVENADGSVLTVYYYNLFNKYYIGGTTWTP